MRHLAAAGRRRWLFAALGLLAVPAFLLLVLMVQGPGFVDEFEAIQPGMTSAEVRAGPRKRKVRS
jgi:hypothetical protein